MTMRREMLLVMDGMSMMIEWVVVGLRGNGRWLRWCRCCRSKGSVKYGRGEFARRDMNCCS
jgi:hypothetical protein